MKVFLPAVVVLVVVVAVVLATLKQNLMKKFDLFSDKEQSSMFMWQYEWKIHL